MTAPTEREVIARIIGHELANCEYGSQGRLAAADRIIAEHIELLRYRNEYDAELIEHANRTIRVLRQELSAANTRASALEAQLAEVEVERNEARELAQRSTRRLVELSQPGWIGALAARDAAEAQLAECVTDLTYAADNIDGILKETDIASIVIRDRCRALLAKLKARTS